MKSAFSCCCCRCGWLSAAPETSTPQLFHKLLVLYDGLQARRCFRVKKLTLHLLLLVFCFVATGKWEILQKHLMRLPGHKMATQVQIRFSVAAQKAQMQHNPYMITQGLSWDFKQCQRFSQIIKATSFRSQPCTFTPHTFDSVVLVVGSLHSFLAERERGSWTEASP